MTAAFFIATGYLNGGVMFNDRVIEAVRRARASSIDCAWLGLGALPVQNDAQRCDAISRFAAADQAPDPAEPPRGSSAPRSGMRWAGGGELRCRIPKFLRCTAQACLSAAHTQPPDPRRPR